MDIIDVIMTRRSIRKFTGVPITKEQEELILKAGFQSPTAHNTQPWEFVVIRDIEVLKGIKAYHPYAKMIDNAGFVILVCGNTQKQGSLGFLIEDCSASIQNILLAAHGIGLGAVWCGIYGGEGLVDKTRELLDIPDNIIPVGLVVVGNKLEDKSPKDRYDANKIHYDKW
ncbi:nitroreductase family protein [Tissierella sp. Yu-01]|uniref:nitroreductase family protein n=1 Tax=Tissierella sp. Yu-01 TaxID=3035694 RepID=UPI00240D5FB5|nr:nitroreductase family protein [Tissierella sp. Yu-01]WFA10241.1 nitroreductase family protein [Tissierella sp. Yu-01]